MTNYCMNRLTIEGSPEQIRAFASGCLSEHGEEPILDFEKILPMPPVLKGLLRNQASRLGGPFPHDLASGVIGMEAIRRTPVAPAHWYGELESVLNHARVRSLGIRNHDDLNDWLRRHEPASLELGRKCLAALDACGCCFEDDWVNTKWGCDADRVDYDQSVLSERAYIASFVSPWGAPEEIIREIARRHPGLAIRFVALEEGNAYAFALTAANGESKEEHPATIVDAFIDEVEGPGEVEDRLKSERAFWEQPPTLRKRPVRHIRHWLNEARLRRALAGYPVYRPPHRGFPGLMPEQQARENHAFFMAEKAGRVEGLKRLLAPFGVRLGFTGSTKDALDSWLASYAAFLYVPEDRCSFLTHEADWVGPRLGLNVILDVSIFIGDFAIHENPALRWDMDANTTPGSTRYDENFQRPALVPAEPVFFFPRDLIYETYTFCNSQCGASYWWKESHFPGSSRALARRFVTKTLRDIHLRARGDSETANKETWQDLQAR
jgi:hypothetical protein